MNYHNNNPNDKGKGKHSANQIKTIFQYLQLQTATASMVSVATGVPQKNICRYKRDLEKIGLLWEVEKKICKETGFKAWCLTTDQNQAPTPSYSQLKLLF
jgi:hypothetical protein